MTANTIRLKLARAHYELAVDLALPVTGISVLFGASGSGKTSILRCVAGLEKAHDAFIQLGSDVWQDDSRDIFVPTHQRELGYVFQEASLFTHLNVRQNLEYGLKRSRRSVEHTHPLDDIIALLGIANLVDRKPNQLSGGERQRVAIARALATNPKVLLLDEPLTSLDIARRKEILPWLERLRDELSIPMIYVTHSLQELERLADHVVIMQAGRCVASSSLQILVKSGSVASLADLDHTTLLEGTVVQHDAQWQLTQIQTPVGLLWVPTNEQILTTDSKHVRIRIQAQDTSLTVEKPSADTFENSLLGFVSLIEPDVSSPAHALIHVRCEQQVLIARLTRKSVHSLQLAPQMPVWARVHKLTIH